MMRLVTLLVFVAFFALATNAKQWYAGYGLEKEETDFLVNAGCFHGMYGAKGSSSGGLTVASCSAQKLTKIGNFSTDSQLCVIETEQPVVNHQHKETLARLNSQLLFSVKGEHEFIIGSASSGSQLPGACEIDHFDTDVVLNVISIPSRPYRRNKRQERPSHLQGPLMNNPVIEHAVAANSAESLKSYIDKLASWHTRVAMSDEAHEAADYIAGHFRENGFQVTTHAFRDTYSPNVIAEMTGMRNPEQIVVMGAHYDSRSTDSYDTSMRAPGADDNGSGTANIMEFARVIWSQKIQFDYTIRLIAFGGEEQGLVGSRAYAKELADANVDVVAMFNGDMLGWKLPTHEIALGMKDRYITEWLLEVAKDVVGLYVPELPVLSSSSCCSDYQSFYENGFAAIGFFENPAAASNYPHYHRSTDLPQYVNMEQCNLQSRAMMATAMTFAVPFED